MPRLSEKQQRLIRWPFTNPEIDGVIAEGAVRSGKTWAMIEGFLLWSMHEFSHKQFIVSGRTMGALKRNVVIPLTEIVLNEFGGPWSYTYNRGEEFIQIGTNRYYLFGASNEQSQDVLQGMTAAGALMDEVALYPQSFIEQAMARCSVDGAKLWFNCNPSFPQHYVKKELIDKAAEKHLLHLHFTMSDNPTLSERVRQRYERMYSGVFYDRFVRGLWVAAEGLVYQDFDADTMTTDMAVEDTYGDAHVLSIDYGITNPFVCLDWIIRAGVAYCVDEYCFDSKSEGFRRTDEEHYEAIRKWVGKRYVDTVVVDPSATSFIETVIRHGEWECMGADNAVLKGISNVMTALGQHGVFISPRCERLMSEFGLYRWNERKPNEEVIKEDDHACDALRYFVNTVGVHELSCFEWD